MTTTESLDNLKQERERLLTEREIAQTRIDIQELTRQAEVGRVVIESLGDWVDPTEYLRDDPSFGRTSGPISRLDDRSDGRYRPIFENEQELSFIRGACRVLTSMCGIGLNILENLSNYTIASGYTYEAVAASESTPTALVEAAQHVIDTFHDDNDWEADLEREIHLRSREDGEAPVILRPRGWRTVASIIEPEQIIAPANSRQLEDWLGYSDQFVSSWSFGVFTRLREPERPIGYHVVYDGAGSDWDYFPASDVPLAMRIGSGVLELIKRNVPRKIKRGFSDFFPVLKHLERGEKLLGNTEEGSAIQAAIAYIREHASTTTASQIQTLRAGQATDTSLRRNVAGGHQTAYRRKYNPGEVIDTKAGTTYKYGPLGQPSGPNFINVVQAAFRYCGARWAMPEYMISSDASNNNFASILIAGSPFVQARQADQRFYKSRFHRIAWLVLRIAFEADYFSRFGMTWEQFERSLNVEVTPPDITISDKLQAAQIKQIERSNGVLSVKTWRKESGRDADVEEKNLKEEGSRNLIEGFDADKKTPAIDPANKEPAAKSSASPGAASSVLAVEPSAMLNGAQITAAERILQGVAAGTTADVAAVALLTAVGIAQDTARMMVRASKQLDATSVKQTTESAADRWLDAAVAKALLR